MTGPQLTIIGDIPATWTVTIDGKVYQTKDYSDVLMALGSAVVARSKHVTVIDGSTPFLDVELGIQEITC